MADRLKKTYVRVWRLKRSFIPVCTFILVLLLMIVWGTGKAEDGTPDSDVFRISNKYLDVTYDAEENSFTIVNLSNAMEYSTAGQSSYQTLSVKKTNRYEMEINQKYNAAFGNLELSVKIILEEERIKFVVSGDEHAELPAPITFPGAISGNEKEQFFAIPYAEGIYVPAVRECEFGEFEMWGHKSTMPFTGMTGRRTGTGIMLTSQTPWDTGIAFAPPESDGNYRMQLVHYPSKGLFGYSRIFYIDVIEDNGYVEMAQRFRRQLEEMQENRKAGEPQVLVTLAQKRKANKNTDKLAGTVDFWLGPEEMKTAAIVDELADNGINNVILNFQYGWKVYEHEKRSVVVGYAAEKGMIPSRYDNYSDIFNSFAQTISNRFRTDGFEGRVIVKENGALQEGYTTYYKGRKVQGYRLNSSFFKEDAIGYLEQDLSENSFLGRFVDVAVSCRLYEDYSPEHPMTRKDDMLHRSSLLETISGRYGMITGTEETAWWAIPYSHYSEGTMTIAAPTGAGEDWSTPVESPGELYEAYTVNPAARIPLKSLVYHDCHISGWYTGDGLSKVLKDWKTKELLTVLYGAMTLVFPGSRELWEEYSKEYLRSIKVTGWALEQVYNTKMVSHRFLSEDGLIQETRFSNEIRIVANFSKNAVTYNGADIPAEDFILIKDHHAYTYDWIIRNYGKQNKM